MTHETVPPHAIDKLNIGRGEMLMDPRYVIISVPLLNNGQIVLTEFRPLTISKYAGGINQKAKAPQHMTNRVFSWF